MVLIDGISKLTERKLGVLQLITNNLNNQQIAENDG